MFQVIRELEKFGFDRAGAEAAIEAYCGKFSHGRSREQLTIRLALPETNIDHMDADLLAEDIVSWYGTPASHR